MLTYIRPVNCNIQNTKGRKPPAKGFGLIIVKNPKTNIIIPLCPSYYIPQNPQNKISKIALKDYNKFRSVRTEVPRWIKNTTDTGMNIEVETTVK